MKEAFASKGSEEQFEKFKSTVKTSERFTSLQSHLLEEWWFEKYWIQYHAHLDHCLNAVEKTLRWRNDYGWYSLENEDFTGEIAQGKCYFHKSDKNGCPIMYWRSARNESPHDKDSQDHTIRFIVSVMEKGIREGMVRERITIITDRMGLKDSKNEGVHFIRGLLSIFQHYFPQMLQKIVIFPAGMVLWTISKVIKPFLDKTIVEKIAIVGENDISKTLEDIISKDNLPIRYGGQSDDPFDVNAVPSSGLVSPKSPRRFRFPG